MEGYEFDWDYTTKEDDELFVDRDAAAEYFWNKLKRVDDAAGRKHSKVITYYGEGGIGKSWLLQYRLYDEVKNRKNELQKKYAVVYHSLEAAQDIVGILCSFRSQIAAQMPRSAFPVFDAAIKHYEILLGRPVKLNSQKTRLEKTAGTIADICTLLSLAPSVGPLYKALTLMSKAGSAEQAADFIKKLSSFSLPPKTKQMIEAIFRKRSTEGVADDLARCFAYDLFNNMHEYSVVFLVDTMEKLEYKDRSPSALRVEKTLLEHLPNKSCNCLWVFAGREKLYPEIKENMRGLEIEEHEIKDLTKEDAFRYLREKQEIGDEEILERIYEITEGTPLFLSMCVETYRNQGCPSIEDFYIDNKRELISRYVKYLSENEQTVVRAMSTIIHWTDRDFEEVFTEVYKYYEIFSDAYDRMIKTSMIERVNDERFFLHRSVRSAIYRDDDYNPKRRDETQAAVIRLYRRRLEEDDCDVVYYRDRFIELMRHLAVDRVELSEELMNDLTYIMFSLSNRLMPFGKDGVQEVIDVLEDICMGAFEDGNENQNFAYALAAFHEKAGNFRRAVEIRERFLELLRDGYKYDDDNPLVIENKVNLARDWCESGRAGDALPMAKQLLAASRRLFGEQDNTTILAKHVCAMANASLEHYDEAVPYYEEIAAALRDWLDDKGFQIYINNDLAYVYAKLGEDEKASGAWAEARAVALSEFGKYDRRTLSVFRTQLKAFRELDKDDEADAVGSQLTDLCRECSGEESQEAVDFIDEAMADFAEVGMLYEAAECAKILLEICRDRYGEDHPDTLIVWGNLGRFRTYINETREGREDLRAVLAKYRSVMDENAPEILGIMTDIANASVMLADYDEAIRIQTEIVEKYKELYGENHEKTLYEIGILEELIENANAE